MLDQKKKKLDSDFCDKKLNCCYLVAK